MLKQTVTYIDFDDKEKTEELRFNITKDRLMQNLHLRDQLRVVMEIMSGPERTLTMEDNQALLNLVKEMIRLSYGDLREEHGRLRFKQDPEVHEAFVESKAYDQFLWDLFEPPEKALIFMTKVLPQELIKEAEAAVEKGEVPDDLRDLLPAKETVTLPGEPVEVSPEDPAELDRVYTQEELRTMPQAEFDKLFGTEPSAWPMNVMQAAFWRKDQTKRA